MEIIPKFEPQTLPCSLCHQKHCVKRKAIKIYRLQNSGVRNARDWPPRKRRSVNPKKSDSVL
jgi:hypothetical protein